MLKKTFTVMLMLCVILTVLTVVVGAEETETPVVAKIGETEYPTFKAALEAVADGETITLMDVTSTEEQAVEMNFDKEITFTITGNAPNYALPIVTYQNATVNIVDATIKTAELDARQDATINVIRSTVSSAGGNPIVKSYYNGAINISEGSKVYTHQATTMGYITVTGEGSLLNVTWQTNVLGNGLITIKDGATLATASLQLTGEPYQDRDNTDPDRVGKPATIVVDNGTLTVGNVRSQSGADYSYEVDTYGINLGTVEGKEALLDIQNGASVTMSRKAGDAVEFGSGATVNLGENTSLEVKCRNESSGEVELNQTEGATININSSDATFAAPNVEELTVEINVPNKNASYENGKLVLSDAIKFEIENGNLKVSYDDGKTWTDLGSVVGPQGPAGADGADGADGTNGADGADGADGASGTNGADGANGEDGITPQLRINAETNEWEVSYNNGETWSSLGVKATGAQGEPGAAGTNGTDGAAGANGTDGADGADGANGEDGEDGITPQLRINTETNEWEISYDNGETWTSLGVKATGEKGAQGEPGAAGTAGTAGAEGKGGITPQLRINAETNEWEVSYDNGETWTSFGVKATGEKGETGAAGADGKDGKDAPVPADEGCGSVIAGSWAGIIAVIAAAGVVLRRKKED